MKKFLYNLLAIVCGLVLWLLLELLLALGGVMPLAADDPFVGFSGSAPLFIEQSPGQFNLNPAKDAYFNSPQSLQMPKPARVFRIVALGGSTTYGRPYLGRTAFVSWLSQLLGRYDPRHRYESLNLGGISYASYRVARVAEEMATYDPDLFVIYAGHNEFLEARTFASQKEERPLLRNLRKLLHHSYVYSLLARLLPKIHEHLSPTDKTLLGEEVAAQLEQVGGVDLYHRDDAFRKGVIEQYRQSMAAMIDRARSRNIPVILCTLPSNLAGMSPFKSEHGEGLTRDDRRSFDELVQSAETRFHEELFADALDLLTQAEAIDSRYALLHYLKGQALEELGRYPEAYQAYLRAKEEDIVPLRALEAFNQILRELARDKKVPLAEVEVAIRGASPNNIPGNVWFDDHVHPTITGQQLIAWEVMEAATRAGIVPLTRQRWLASREDADRFVRQAVLDLPAEYTALGDWGVGRLFFWSAKYAEAYPALVRAWATLRTIAEIPRQIAAIEYMRGEYRLAYEWLEKAAQIDAEDPQAKLLMAQTLAALQRSDEALELLSTIPEDMVGKGQLLLVQGDVQLRSEHYADAVVSLQKAAQLAPEASFVRLSLARAYRGLGDLAQAEREYRLYRQLVRDSGSEEELLSWLKGD